MNTLPKYRLVHNRTGKLIQKGTNKGKALIQIEVYQYNPDRPRKKYISTTVYVEKNHWKDGKVRGDRHELRYNKIIKEKVDEIDDYLANEGESFDWERFENFLDGTYNQSFNDFVKLEIEKNNEIKRRSLSQHFATHTHLNNFKKNIGFKSINYQLIKDFDSYLRGLGLKDSTVYGHHKRLKSYVHEAVKYSYVRPQDDPYKSFKLKTVKYETIRYLEESELVNLRDYDFSEQLKLERVRDFFVFCCYTGLGYQDAANFRKNDIVREDGEMFIQNPRLKTDETAIVLLFDEALNILEKYGYELPVISNQKTNDFLKIIAAAVGIDKNKNLVSHCARHTYAVLLLNKGMRMETVSRCLGHSSPKTTMETYARVLKSTIKKEALEVKKKLK